MATKKSSCKTFSLFCKNYIDLNIYFSSTDQLTFSNEPIENVLCLSGGGSRSFLLSIIIMRELERAKKLNEFKLIGSVSGGSWANCLYRYGKYESRDVFLGKSLEPENITINSINTIDSKCVLSCVNNKVSDLIKNGESELQDLFEIANGTRNVSDIWKFLIYELYLKPFSVSDNKFYADSKEQLNNILLNQPNLQEDDFILPNITNLPYPLYMSTIVGPTSLEPYESSKNAQFTIFELTSQNAGVYYAQNNGIIKYVNEENTASSNIDIEGFVNSQAFNGNLSNNKKTTRITNVNSILNTISISSWAIGAYLDTIGVLLESFYYVQKFTNRNNTTEMLFADGGAINNEGIISMVQRKTKKIFSCINTNLKFNYYIDKSFNYNLNNVPTSFIFASLFGIITNDNLSPIEKRSYDFKNAHIFKKENYNTLINAMHEVEQKGDGIICTVEVETIENTWYNISAGNKIELTIFYNSLPLNWYNKLDDSIKSIVDEKKLPFISTNLAEISAEEIHLVDSMTSWTMRKYMDKI
jgi:hypothetical protein